ncbi:cytochrome P450 [Aspergillus ibericus CBS 121593]|uniref:Putative cytochrome P450 n=1 Tax=Aspergillus ibericus CBS 121593 TaxID=1448316 RepID=A0A395GUY7_9EURO|nr:putative cytochrome P450 [Aspergillus ibericus CBS 121593]RAK99286.1 putative cytochrome P450 [Aspergillus ibericus CBS 121593]
MDSLYLWLVPSLIIFSILARSIYRLYFHPLSKFPGPKLAAITHLFEFYYDVVQDGMFLWEIEKMHEKYGPIVRINPRELHIKDPHYYDQIYVSGGKKRNKDPHFVPLFAAPLSMITTVDHEHHRFRRGLLSNFFSKKSVANIALLIQSKVASLTDRFEQAYRDGTTVDLTAAFCALTGDIIFQYTFGESLDFLHDNNFKNDIRGSILELESVNHLNRFAPILIQLFQLMPSGIMSLFKPATAALLGEVTKKSQRALQSSDHQSSDKKDQTLLEALSSPTIPADERTLARLKEESMILLSGGTESPANALSVAAFHLYNDKSIIRKLREELQPVMPCAGDSVPLADLEQLPYLTGVVNEALRLSYGLVSRPPRVAPDEALTYGDFTIPPGTPVSTSSYFMNTDPTIFPNPESFNPERWILAKERGENLTRFMASFGKGSRACIGINLGYAELYYTIAAMARRFDFELCETTEDNIRVVRDRGLPFSKDGHWRVKAKVSKIYH